MLEYMIAARRVLPAIIIAMMAVSLSGPVGAADFDLDGIEDSADNCLEAANADQRDTDGDGIGNLCDADFDNDCGHGFLDLGRMKANFLVAGDLDTDMNGDGRTNFLDLGLMKEVFLGTPGPSGVPNVCGLGVVTYREDTQPIFAEKCDPCHAGLGFGGHNIATSYLDALLPAQNPICRGGLVGECTIVRIQLGQMPADAPCSGDPALDEGNAACLTALEQELVQAWIAAGLPE